jgi:uncharacterized protein with HEPN domain
MNGTAFLEDHRTYDAVERCLERISEAAKKLGEEAEALCLNIAWPQLRALGNFSATSTTALKASGFGLWSSGIWLL